MKTIAENANDFSSIRTMDHGSCIYVDKTDYFHRLVTSSGKKLLFIARPRRFGKALMITTFKYIFEGRPVLPDRSQLRHEDAPARRRGVGRDKIRYNIRMPADNDIVLSVRNVSKCFCGALTQAGLNWYNARVSRYGRHLNRPRCDSPSLLGTRNPWSIFS